jgi:hypothetical protein
LAFHPEGGATFVGIGTAKIAGMARGSGVIFRNSRFERGARIIGFTTTRGHEHERDSR